MFEKLIVEIGAAAKGKQDYLARGLEGLEEVFVSLSRRSYFDDGLSTH